MTPAEQAAICEGTKSKKNQYRSTLANLNPPVSSELRLQVVPNGPAPGGCLSSMRSPNMGSEHPRCKQCGEIDVVMSLLTTLVHYWRCRACGTRWATSRLQSPN